MARTMDRYWHGSDFIDPEEIEAGGITHEHTRKWQVLTDLQVCFGRCGLGQFRTSIPC